MIRRYRLIIICGFILVIGLALWPGRWSRPAYANVTLVSFTATSSPGEPAIILGWETATEFDTVGFFIARSDISAGPFARVSPFITHEGDTIGAQYHFTDTTTVLNQTYYYRLEVVNTDQTVDYHGPISAIAGPATNTPTNVPSPTATSTSQPATEAVDPTLPPNSGIVVTRRAATGATITPRPTSSSSSSSSPVTFAAAPTLSSVPNNALPPTPVAAAAFAIPDAATVATVVAPPPPTAVIVAQASAPTLVSTAEASVVVEPVVIAPGPAPSTMSTDSTNSGALALIAVAILLLGIALFILRQARQ